MFSIAHSVGPIVHIKPSMYKYHAIVTSTDDSDHSDRQAVTTDERFRLCRVIKSDDLQLHVVSPFPPIQQPSKRQMAHLVRDD